MPYQLRTAPLMVHILCADAVWEASSFAENQLHVPHICWRFKEEVRWGKNLSKHLDALCSLIFLDKRLITVCRAKCGRNCPHLLTHFSCRDGRDDGVALEENLSTPMSSSMKLSRLMGDKLHTRLTLAAARVAVPSDLGFAPFSRVDSKPPWSLTFDCECRKERGLVSSPEIRWQSVFQKL